MKTFLSIALALIGSAMPIAADAPVPGSASTTTILASPKVDAEGYLPTARKRFYISGPAAVPSSAFNVVDGSGDSVYEGHLSAAFVDDTASSGERTLYGDFSSVTAPQVYSVRVGDVESARFRIGGDVYVSLYKDALRTFRLIRCGAAINDPITGIKHAICHSDDTHIRGEPGTSDFTGGWHNAGDYGKWTHMAAITVTYMMLLANLQKSLPNVSIGMQ